MSTEIKPMALTSTVSSFNDTAAAASSAITALMEKHSVTQETLTNCDNFRAEAVTHLAGSVKSAADEGLRSATVTMELGGNTSTSFYVDDSGKVRNEFITTITGVAEILEASLVLEQKLGK